MPKYVKGEEKQHFTVVIAAIIVGAIAVASLIYSLVINNEKANLEEDLLDTENVVKINPGSGLATPKSAPNVIPPTTPPPGN